MPYSFNINKDAANPVLSAPPEHLRRIGRSAVLNTLIISINVSFLGSLLECNERSICLMFNWLQSFCSGVYHLDKGFSPRKFMSDLILFRFSR